MSCNKIKIIRDVPLAPVSSREECSITFDELKQWALSGNLLRHLFRYREVRLITYRADVILKPFLTALLLKLLSRGKCFIEDQSGHHQAVTTPELVRLFSQFTKDLIGRKKAVSRIHNELFSGLENNARHPVFSGRNIVSGRPAYLRTDLWFGVSSGGSIGHIAGVLNNLDHFTGKPVFLTSDAISTVRRDVETYYIAPDRKFWDFLELPSLFYNTNFYQESQKILEDKNISFIYQRYSLNNYTGLKLAQRYGIPFVLEYNGSEIWVSRHWGNRLKYEELSERIEMLNLKAAQLIVVVSQPLKDELVNRGIEPDKILVNPNGVDSDRYSPKVDGSSIRVKYHVADKTVIGFIGTFGHWHGAEVLAEAFGRLLKEYPVYRDSVKLLMIGDGMTMPLVKEELEKYTVGDACILTGRIPQEDGPAYLAACDILASPHIPNPDGTPFFGSPTKLFEYMAMGKGIVASDLDQIGEILKHDKTALVVKPGDAQSLMLGLKMLIDHKELRERLGRAAREEVVANYTWKEHTRKIVEKLKSVVGSA
jgi:glycosyltransferase involved in cell wall biosynthesis